jgi:hypothetical protein
MEAEPIQLEVIDLATINVLLMPSGDGELPQIVSESRNQQTGFERRTIEVSRGSRRHVLNFAGPTLMGSGPVICRQELQRIAQIRAVLDQYEANIRDLQELFEP